MILQELIHLCFCGGLGKTFSGFSVQESPAVGSTCIVSLNTSKPLPRKLYLLTFPWDFVFLHLRQHLILSNFLIFANLMCIRPIHHNRIFPNFSFHPHLLFPHSVSDCSRSCGEGVQWPKAENGEEGTSVSFWLWGFKILDSWRPKKDS